MTHMEGGFKDDQEQAAFLLHVEQLRYGLALANEYGAKFTVESEMPFTRACQTWEVNAMQEVLNLGHGVGTHCDIGFGGPTLSDRARTLLHLPTTLRPRSLGSSSSPRLETENVFEPGEKRRWQHQMPSPFHIVVNRPAKDKPAAGLSLSPGLAGR